MRVTESEIKTQSLITKVQFVGSATITLKVLNIGKVFSVYFLSTKYMTPQSNVFLSCNQWQAMNVFLHYAKSRHTGDRLDSIAVSIFVNTYWLS